MKYEKMRKKKKKKKRRQYVIDEERQEGYERPPMKTKCNCNQLMNYECDD